MIAIAAVALIAMAPALWLGHVVGHSSVLNVNWAEGFATALEQGEIYPRWLPEQNGGAGSPVFYFYGPLPFYLAAPFVWATGHAALGVICAEVVMLACSGFALFKLACEFCDARPALIAALAYMVLPYHFATDIWFRAAMAEQASFVFMPLCLLFLFRLQESWRAVIWLALSFAAQLYSHLPTALLFAPVLVAFTVALVWQSRDWRLLIRAGAAAALAGLLTSAYLVPALLAQDMIQPSFWMVDSASDNLLFGEKSLSDLSIFMLPLGLEFGLLGWLVASVLRDPMATSAKPFAIVTAACLIAIGVWAKPLWDHMGFYNRVQFPWRILSFVELGLTVVLAHMLTKGRAVGMLALLAVVIFTGLGVAAFSQFEFQHLADAPGVMTIGNDRKDFALKTDASEYLPACYQIPAGERHAMTSLLAARNQASTADNQPSIFYYRFLRGQRGGSPVDLRCDPATGFAVAADGSLGILNFEKATLPEEKWGMLLAALGLVLTAFVWWRTKPEN